MGVVKKIHDWILKLPKMDFAFLAKPIKLQDHSDHGASKEPKNLCSEGFFSSFDAP